MGALLTSDERALLDRWSGFAQALSGDRAILDRQMRCAAFFGRELLALGESLAEHAADPLVYPLKEACSARILLRGECFCADIEPIRNEAGDAALYLCTFTDTRRALEAAGKTDALMKLVPLCGTIETNFAAMWGLMSELEKHFEQAGDFATVSKMLSMRSALSLIGSASASLYEYTSMLSVAPSVRRIDAAGFCEMLVKRCNAALAKCGRYVEFAAEPELAPIRVDARHAMCALVNAIQNALLYSPRESVPVVAVMTEKTGARRYVVIRVSNETSLFTAMDFRTLQNVEYSYQKSGVGLAVIERFVNECGGRLAISEEGGRYVLTLTFAAADNAADTVRFEAPVQAQYDTGVPDLLELCMAKVAEVFGEK